MTREQALIEDVATETGTAIGVVSRVLNLMHKLSEREVGLELINDEIAVEWLCDWKGNEPDIRLPDALWNEIEALDFNIMELLNPIRKAWQDTYRKPFPTMMQFKSIAKAS